MTDSGVGQNDRVTIFTDGAGEFAKAVHGASRPTCRILDWFHIAKKFRAIDLTAGSRRDLLAPNGRDLCEETVDVSVDLAQQVADGLGIKLPKAMPLAMDKPTKPEVIKSAALFLTALQ